MPSQAFKELAGSRLGEVATLLTRRPSTDEADRSRAEQDEAIAVNRAAVVLLCAHFEGYLDDLAVEVADHLNREVPPISTVPDALVACQLDKDLETIVKTTHRTRRVAKTTDLVRTIGEIWSEGTLAASPVRADAIIGEMANPKPKAVGRLFERIGIADVFSQVNISTGDPTWRLNELVAGRNDIAHGRSRSILDQDVTRDQLFVKDLASELDDLTALHLQTICGAAQRPWP